MFEVTLPHWAVKLEGKVVDQTSDGSGSRLCLISITWITSRLRSNNFWNIEF